MGWHVRGKYGPLGCMASIVGATKMLLWFPTIPQELFPFMKERGLVPHVSLVKLDCIYCFVALTHLRENRGYRRVTDGGYRRVTEG